MSACELGAGMLYRTSTRNPIVPEVAMTSCMHTSLAANQSCDRLNLCTSHHYVHRSWLEMHQLGRRANSRVRCCRADNNPPRRGTLLDSLTQQPTSMQGSADVAKSWQQVLGLNRLWKGLPMTRVATLLILLTGTPRLPTMAQAHESVSVRWSSVGIGGGGYTSGVIPTARSAFGQHTV